MHLKTFKKRIKNTPKHFQKRAKIVPNLAVFPLQIDRPSPFRHSGIRTPNSEFASLLSPIKSVRTPITPHPPLPKNNYAHNSRVSQHLQTPPSILVRTNMVLHPFYRCASVRPLATDHTRIPHELPTKISPRQLRVLRTSAFPFPVVSSCRRGSNPASLEKQLRIYPQRTHLLSEPK